MSDKDKYDMISFLYMESKKKKIMQMNLLTK